MEVGIILENKKYFYWLIAFGVVLVLLSMLLYIIHYFIFRDAHHIFIFLVKDMAFLPVKVLFITLIVHHLLSSKEKRVRLEKMNMLISAFFSGAGTRLLRIFAETDPRLEEIKRFALSFKWSEEDMSRVHKFIQDFTPEARIEKVDLQELKLFLSQNRDFFLRQLENPTLLEHESFTELLQAVFHLTDELFHREDLEHLPDTDYSHLAGDIKRAYVLLVREWFAYMLYLKKNYPYLFSLALRLNPFDREASAVVRQDV